MVQVTAAENFWGSIASQIGGEHAHVVSIITNPNTDPHAYEPTASDARLLAQAQMVVENGLGYDPWVPKLLSADRGLRPRSTSVPGSGWSMGTIRTAGTTPVTSRSSSSSWWRTTRSSTRPTAPTSPTRGPASTRWR